MHGCARRFLIAGAVAIVAATVAVAPALATVPDAVSPGQIFLNNVPFNDNGTPGEPIYVDPFHNGCGPEFKQGGQGCYFAEGSDGFQTGPTRFGDPMGITFVAAVIDSSTVTITSAQAVWGDYKDQLEVKEPCDITASSADPRPGSTFTCQANPQVAGIDLYEVNLTFSDPSYTGGWKETHISANPFHCRAGDRLASPAMLALAAAADPCAPPSNPKITFAKVTERNRSAQFKFKAHRATHYTCVLGRNGQMAFSRACKSPMRFSGPLKPGRYLFIVQAANDGGDAVNAAAKHFTIR